MPEEQKTLTNRDPKAGCLIMIIGAIIFGGLIIYTLTLPFKQSRLMQDFTETAPLTLATKQKIPSPTPHLLQTMQDVPRAMDEGRELTLKFTKEDLNSAIQYYEEFLELRGKMEVTEITAKEMVFRISFPLRSAPFSDHTPYLNGFMHAVPEIMNDEIILNVSHIQADTGIVPEGFLNHFKPYRIMAKYSEHPTLGRAMFSAKEVTLSDEAHLSLSLNPEKYADPKAVESTSPDLEKKKKRSTIMTVSSFLMIGGLFFFLVRRRNAQSAQAFQNSNE